MFLAFKQTEASTLPNPSEPLFLISFILSIANLFLHKIKEVADDLPSFPWRLYPILLIDRSLRIIILGIIVIQFEWIGSIAIFAELPLDFFTLLYQVVPRNILWTFCVLLLALLKDGSVAFYVGAAQFLHLALAFLIPKNEEDLGHRGTSRRNEQEEARNLCRTARDLTTPTLPRTSHIETPTPSRNASTMEEELNSVVAKRLGKPFAFTKHGPPTPKGEEDAQNRSEMLDGIEKDYHIFSSFEPTHIHSRTTPTPLSITPFEG